MGNPDSAQTILALLSGKKRQAGRVILVTGPWGCGKTFLWKQTVAPQLRRPNIYVSAFGAEGAGNLKGRLLAHFALGLLERVPLGSDISKKAAALGTKLQKKLGRSGRVITSSLNSIGGSFLRRADIDPLELADLLPAETVICIDDIERISGTFHIEDLLGMVNVLSEHKGFDLVLICNEDQITRDKERGEIYARHKEKVVSTEFHVSGDPSLMFDRISQSVVGADDARERVQAAKSTILEVFGRSKTENLRVLAKVLTQLEAMFAAGVRELTQVEVRFLAAITIQIAVDSPQGDQFFEFNPFVLRVAAAMAARSKKEEPHDAARKAFLERYFGDADYEFHAGIDEAVRKGRIDPSKFERAAAPELAGVKKTLAIVTNGSWRFWSDAQVGELVKELVAYIEDGDPKSARDVLDCLAYARFLASILEQPLPQATSLAAETALQAMAEAGDESLGPPWEIQMSQLVDLVRPEHAKFVEATRKANQQRLTNSIANLIKNGDVEGVARLLGEPQRAPLEAVFAGLGLDSVMELRRTNLRLFTILVRSLMEQGQAFLGVWPAVQTHLDELSKQLRAIADDPNEERMVRWQAQGLLK